MNRATLTEIVNHIHLPNKMFFVVGDYPELTVRVRRKNDVCNVTKLPNYTWEGRRWIIEEDYTESEVLRACLQCFLQTMEHELREQFIYYDRIPFGPHFEITDFMKIADKVS